MNILNYRRNLKSFARSLRSNQTPAEELLWQYLRRKQIFNIRFSRQTPIGSYIVDFYAKEAKLVIEIDGSQHYEKIHQQYDQKRDKYLKGLGLDVLRFNNLEVLEATETVLHIIECKIQGKPYITKHGEYFEL